MTSVVLPGSGGTATFKYDPFGRRIQKVFTEGSTTTATNYVYDGPNSVEEFDQNGSLLARYSQAAEIDEPLSELRSGTSSYYEQDGLRSITSLTGSSDTISNSYTYDTFGNVIASNGNVVNPFQYTGRDYDSETGLRYYRARYYDSTSGRFIAEDPIHFGGGSNFYEYVGNSAINTGDFSGLCPSTKNPCDVPDHPWYASVDINILSVWAAGPAGYAYWLANILPGGPWDYKRIAPQYDDFGNFNFGATGSALGFSDESLLRGAGFLKDLLLKLKHKPNPNGSPLGNFPYGNEYDKQVVIQHGIDYYKAGCWLWMRRFLYF